MSRIPTGKARGLAKNYKQNKLGKKLKEDDTRGIWFSKEVFYEALGLERDPATGLLKETKIPYYETDVFPDGIRLYFGAYSENHLNEVRRGKLTVVLVSTGNSGQNNPEYHYDILTSPDEVPQDDLGSSDVNIMDEFNDGQLCPPPACDPKGLLKF